ncbi:hypothetical protein ENT_20400 [Enterococcus faecalis]|nr:hypothetical protein ENT_20400 [Enterococcus faecalis]
MNFGMKMKIMTEYTI